MKVFFVVVLWQHLWLSVHTVFFSEDHCLFFPTFSQLGGCLEKKHCTTHFLIIFCAAALSALVIFF